MRVIINEVKKIILSKKYMVAMIILVVVYGLLCYATYSETRNRTPENQLIENNRSIEQFKKEMSNKGISDKKKESIEAQIKDIENLSESVKLKISNKDLGWRELLENNNSALREKLKEAEKDEKFNAIQGFNMMIKKNQYYLENNIKPSEDYEVTAVSTLYKTNIVIGAIILSVIIAIIGSDSISGEYNSGTIKLLLTKPISRQRVLLSKFVATVLTCVVSLAIIKFILFLIIGIIFKFGDFRDPIIFYSRFIEDREAVIRTGYGVKVILDSLTIYSTLKVILLNELITVLYIAACTSICFLISTISKKNAVSIGVSMIIFAITSIFSLATVFGSVGSDIKIIHKIMVYLFSTYSNGQLIINRMVTERIGESFINMPFIIGVLLTWTIGCYLISNAIFVKKDILA